MGLTEQIQQDLLAITTNANDFGVSLTFTAPTSPVIVVTTTGTAKRHHLEFDEMGMVKGNSLNATCTISELALRALSYPVRNTNGDVTFKGHLVTWTDITGSAITYAINEWFPDETTGLIVLILGDYGAN